MHTFMACSGTDAASDRLGTPGRDSSRHDIVWRGAAALRRMERLVQAQGGAANGPVTRPAMHWTLDQDEFARTMSYNVMDVVARPGNA